MNSRKLTSIFALALLALLWLGACGAPPVELNAIPAPPNATLLERGSNPAADAAVDAAVQSLSSQNLKPQVKLYALPANASWDEIKTFYTNNLKEGDWKAEPAFTNEAGVFNTTGWTRGGQSQALMVGYGPDNLATGSSFVMIVMASR